MPGIASSAASSVGRRSAMASRVASENTTNAGTDACADRLLRQMRRASTNSGSAVDGQREHRPILISTGVSNLPPQVRQRPGALCLFPGLLPDLLPDLFPDWCPGVAVSGASPVR